MNNVLRLWLLPAVSAVLVLPAVAKTVIYPVEAIPDFWKLNAKAFDEAYGGINITGMGVGDEGWYIRYRHENLTLLFGPIADREEARQRMWDMEEVRAAVIRQRQTLATSQVDMVRFDFSGVYGARGQGGGGGGGRISADGRHGPDGDLDGDGIPNSQDPDMDGDGIPNEQDGDIDGDGVPNDVDDYPYGNANAAGLGADQRGGGQGGQQQGGGNRISADGRSGPDGDMDGDGIPNALDGDMDGDGIPNAQDGDMDGDGIPNAQDDYPYGTNDGTLAAAGGQPGQQGQPGQPGQQGQQQGQQGQPGQQQQRGQQGQQQQQQQGQPGQPGQQGQPSSPGQQGQPGSPSQPSMPGAPGSPGAPNPIEALFGLLRRALGL